MKKIPCELTLGNGGDVVAMVPLEEDGTLKVPRYSLYGTFQEGVIACRVMNPDDQKLVVREEWQDQ